MSSDYCFDSKGCSKRFSYVCSKNICSKNKQNCRILKSWSLMKNHIYIQKVDRSFETFIASIKEFQKWKPNDVCFNNAICFQNSLLSHRFWLIGRVSTQLKIKCKCNAKYSKTCGKDQNYCAFDAGDAFSIFSIFSKMCESCLLFKLSCCWCYALCAFIAENSKSD